MRSHDRIDIAYFIKREMAATLDEVAKVAESTDQDHDGAGALWLFAHRLRDRAQALRNEQDEQDEQDNA